MLQPFALQEMLALLRFERWVVVLAAPAPPSGRDVQIALHYFARGVAHAGLGQAGEAETAEMALAEAAARVPKDAPISAVNSAAAVLDVARARSRGAHRRRERRRRRIDCRVDAGGRARRHARLQRAARLATANARTPGRGAAHERPRR